MMKHRAGARVARPGRRAIFALLTVSALFIAIVGLAHTAPGRPLLSVIGPVLGMRAGGGKCPLGYDAKATPEQKEATRRRFAASHAGSTRAAERPAFGFVLDQTTKADVVAWAAEHAITCVVPRSGSDLDCSDVPTAAFPSPQQGLALHSLWLNFGAGERLVSVIGIRQGHDAQSISDAFAQATETTTHMAGPPTTTGGDASPAALASGDLYQAMAEYRFANYFAVARATNMGHARGFVLTEEYRSL